MTKILPREKLASVNIQALEDHELLSLIIGRGTSKEDVFSLAQRILNGFDREELMAEKRLTNFEKRFQLSSIKAAQIMGSIELGRRLFQKPPSSRQIQNISNAYQIVKSMQYLKKEYLRGLYLNTRNRIIHDEIISIGTLDTNILHPREIFRPAIEYGAYAIIIAHNHPSGDPTPSESDLVVTEKLLSVAELLQIPLLDHLIIGESTYFSFSNEKLLTIKQDR